MRASHILRNCRRDGQGLLRELEVTRPACADLQARQDQLGSELQALQAQCQVEQKDIARLEHLSLSRVLVVLKGSHEEALAREQAEADGMRMRVADAQARLEAVRTEHQGALDRLDHLASAPDAYAALLAEKEQHLTESGDPRRATLLSLADERGRLNAEFAEMNQAAAEADRRMAVLRTDLTELDQAAQTSPLITLSSATKFVDLWFNNIFTDLAVRDRIQQAQQNVAQSLQMVGAVQERLKAQSAEVQSRLTQIEDQRRDLLAQ